MSRSIGLFIDSDLPLDRLAEQLDELTSASFVASSASTYAVRAGEIYAELYEHDFFDDGDLPLAHYRYVLMARCANAMEPAGTPESTWLRSVGAALVNAGLVPALLVSDLQHAEQAFVAPEEGAQ